MSDQEDGNRKVAQEQRSQQEAARRQQEAQQAQQAREAQQYAQQQRAQEQAGRQQEQQQRQQEQSQRSKEQQDKRTDANKKQDDKHDDHQDDTKSRQEQTSTAGEHQRSSSAADSLNGPAKHPVTERSSTEEHRSDDKAGIAQTGTPTEQPHAQRDESDQRNASASATTTQGRAGAATDAAASQAPPADGQHNDAHAVTGGTGETMPPGTGEVINRTSATDGRAGGAHADGGQHDDPTNGAHNDNANATFAQSLNPDHGDSDETLRRILDFTGEGDGEPDAVEHEHPPAIGHGAVQPVTTPADADRHDDHTNSNANSSSNPAGSGHKYGPPEDIHLYPPGTNASHDPAEQPTRTEGAREDAPVDRQRSLPHTSLDGSPANGPLSAGDPTRVQPAPTTPPASPSIPDHGAAQSLAGRHSTGRDAVIAAAMAGFDGDDPAEEQTTPEVRAFERVVHDAGPGARRPTLALPTDDPSPTGVILEASRHVSTIDQVHERWGVTSKADLAAAARDADDHLNTSLSADERTRYESEAGEIRQEALSRALPYVPGPQLHQISDALHATLTELQSYEEVSGATQTLRSLAAVDHEIERRDALPRETHAPRPSLISTWSDSANRHIYGDRTDDGAEIGRGITRAVVNTLNIPALVADGIVLGYHSVHDPQTYDPAQHMTASSYTVIQTDNAGDDEALIRAGIDQAGSIAASLVPVASEGMATVALIEALRSGDRGRIGEAGAGLVLTVAPRIVSRLRSEPGVSEPPRQLPGATVESPPRLPAGEGSSRSGGAGTGSGGPPLGIGPEPHDTLVDHPAAGPTSTPAGAPPVSAPVDAQGTGGVPDVEGLDTAAAPPTPESAALTPQQVQRIAAQAAHGDPVVTARVERAIEDLRGDPTVSFDSARNISAMAHHIAEAARTRNITHVLSETEFSHARQQWRQRDMNEPGQTTVHLREFRQAYEYHLAGGEGEPPDGFRTDDNVTHILDDPTTRRGPGPAAEPVDPHATTGLHNTPPHPPAQTPGPPPTTAPSTHTTGPEPHDTLVDAPVPGGPRGGPGEPTPRDTIVTGSHATPDQIRQFAEAAANGDAHIAGRVERALHDMQGNRTIHFDSIDDVHRAAEYLAHQAGSREITQVFPEATARALNEAWHHGATSFDHYGNVHFAILEAEHSFQWHLAGGEGTAPDAFRTADGITHVRNADLPTPPGITATPQTYGDAPATRVPVAQVGPSAAPVDPPPLAQLDAGAANALGQTPARAAPAGVVRPDPAQAPRPGPAAGAGHGPAAPRQWPAGKRDRMVAMSAVTPEQGAGAEPPAGFIARHDALGAGTVARPVNPSPPQGEPPNPPGPPTPAGAQPERPVAAGDAARTERRLPAFFDDGEVLPRDQWGLNRNPPAQRVSLNEVTSPNIGMMLQVWARLKEIDPGLADDYLRGLGIEPDERR